MQQVDFLKEIHIRDYYENQATLSPSNFLNNKEQEGFRGGGIVLFLLYTINLLHNAISNELLESNLSRGSECLSWGNVSRHSG